MIHLFVDANDIPVPIIITAGTVNDCLKSSELIESMPDEGFMVMIPMSL